MAGSWLSNFGISYECQLWVWRMEWSGAQQPREKKEQPSEEKWTRKRRGGPCGRVRSPIGSWCRGTGTKEAERPPDGESVAFPEADGGQLSTRRQQAAASRVSSIKNQTSSILSWFSVVFVLQS